MKLLKNLFILLLLILVSNPAFSDEKVLKIKAGETFNIELNSNPTTGYQWQLVKPLDKNIIELVSSYYISPKTNLMGAGNKEIWIFRAVKPGKTTISFKYVRLWEDTQPESQILYIIDIK